MGKKRVPQHFITVAVIIVLIVLNFICLNLIGCGGDEAETVSETEQFTDEEQRKLLRFVEYVLFPTSPYIDKSWVEIVQEDEVAEKFIDYATETAGIQQTFTEFYNAYNAHDTRAMLATLYAHGIEVQIWGPKRYSKATVRSALENVKGSWGPSPMLADFYIRPANVKAPYPEASAYGYNGPGGFGGITYLYLIKQGDRWLINQISTGSLSISKYFDDPKYKAP